MSSPFELFWLLPLAAIAWFMWDSLKAREAAVSASRAACTAEGLQFLDDTVAIQRVRPVRANGALKLQRVYGFEYTESGDSRRKGSVVLVGEEVLVLNLDFQRPRHLPLH